MSKITRRGQLLATALALGSVAAGRLARAAGADAPVDATTTLVLDGTAGGKRFDGIGVVNGGGATSVLLKDYVEPQRSQILDLLFKPKFGASVSALLVEIPGDGNSTQGAMPSHMHTRDDLDHGRGYTWWILGEAKKRNPALTLDAVAWSAPGWVGEAGELFPRVGGLGDDRFFSRDTITYYLRWLEGLRHVHGLELDAIGVRNEKGVSYGFAKALRKALNEGGFPAVRLHAFDNWPEWKLDFVADMLADEALRDSIDAISAHTFHANFKVGPAVRAMAERMGKPIWNTEEHVYLKGFDCAIGIVQCFNRNYIDSGATKIVNWYDIAALYPIEPFAEDPAAVLAYEPWSGHYQVREALWGYAHYGQFTEVGWSYLDGGSGPLPMGGSHVTLKSPGEDFSVIVETQGARDVQTLRMRAGPGLSRGPLCIWHSNRQRQFVRLADLQPIDGWIEIQLEPDAIYSISSTRGQRKGGFDGVPAPRGFPLPYAENFASYASPRRHGHLPRYTADIAGAFELVPRPDAPGHCLRQMVPVPTISWAPDWRPYTILGSADWSDYEVGVEVWLTTGDTAGVMGRIHHVGTGYGFIPKAYYLELSDSGECRLVSVRGKKDPKAIVGDAEQQALIKAVDPDGEGGERVLGVARLTPGAPGRWHSLALRFEGPRITALVDGRVVASVLDAQHGKGMVGLLAGAEKRRLSTPYFNRLSIRAIGGPAARPPPVGDLPPPIYEELLRI